MSNSRSSRLLRADRLADNYERRRRAGEPSAIDDILESVDPRDRELLRQELLLVDAELQGAVRSESDTSELLQSYASDPDSSQAALPESLSTNGDRSPTLARVPIAGANTPANFGDYVFLNTIACGGMGVVYRARQVSLQRLVAIKMLHDGAAAEKAKVKRFQQEASAAARLRHPNIVSVHEFSHHAGQYYLVMDLIEGQSLADLIRQNPLSPGHASRLFHQVATAIAFAHEQGVIHRDLKPSNILLDASHRALVTDFGLAQEFDTPDRITLTGTLIGTPGYMAPELMSGRYAACAASDVYALGATLYECLTGHPPFRAASALETFMHAVERDPVPLRTLNPRIPRDLETICLKCLEKNPQRRYATVADLRDDVARHVAGKPIVARPVSILEHFYRYSLRHPAIVAMSSVALLLALLTVAVSLGAAWKVGVANRSLASALDRMALAELEARYSAQQADRRARAEAEARQRAEVAESLAHREMERANSEAHSAQQIARFLEGMFRLSDPFGPQVVSQDGLLQPADFRAKDILNKASRDIHVQLGDQPIVRASLMHTIGTVFNGLGAPQEAEPLLREAYAIRLHHLRPDSLEIGDTLFQLGSVAQLQFRMREAQRLFRESLMIRESQLAATHRAVLESKLAVAWQLAMREDRSHVETDEAIALLRDVLRDLPSSSNEVATLKVLALIAMAWVQGTAERDLLEAFACCIQASEVVKQCGNPEFAQGLRLIPKFFVEYGTGKFPQAIATLQESLSHQKTALGSTHPLMIWGNSLRADVLAQSQDYQGAINTLRDVQAECVRLFGSQHPTTVRTRAAIANTYALRGDHEAAACEDREMLALARKDSSEQLAELLVLSASLACLRRDYEHAVGCLEEAVDLYRESHGELHPAFAHTWLDLFRVNSFLGHLTPPPNTLMRVVAAKQIDPDTCIAYAWAAALDPTADLPIEDLAALVERTLRDHRQRSDLHRAMSGLLLRLGRTQEALNALAPLQGISVSRDRVASALRALVLQRAGQTTLAAALRNEVKITPDSNERRYGSWTKMSNWRSSLDVERLLRDVGVDD